MGFFNLICMSPLDETAKLALDTIRWGRRTAPRPRQHFWVFETASCFPDKQKGVGVRPLGSGGSCTGIATGPTTMVGIIRVAWARVRREYFKAAPFSRLCVWCVYESMPSHGVVAYSRRYFRIEKQSLFLARIGA